MKPSPFLSCPPERLRIGNGASAQLGDDLALTLEIVDANHRELFYELLLQDFENNERTIIIATHLIEEVTNIIEEVVLIDHGKIILQDTVESLLETGYSVSGISHEVDQYCSDKNVIGHDELGNMKIAYILDNKTSIPPDSSLHFSSMNLQKLFVKLTEKGGK